MITSGGDQRAMQVAGLVDDLARQSKHDRAKKGGKSNKLKRGTITGVRTKTSKRARVSERKVSSLPIAIALADAFPQELGEAGPAFLSLLTESIEFTRGERDGHGG